MLTTSLRRGIFYLTLGLMGIAAVVFYRKTSLERFANQKLEQVASIHVEVRDLFQASYYFFYQSDFLPGVKKRIQETPFLNQIQIISKNGMILFDSSKPSEKAISDQQNQNHPVSPEVKNLLHLKEPQIFTENYAVKILVPSGQYSILYQFDASEIKSHVMLALTAVLLGLGVIVFFFHSLRKSSFRKSIRKISRFFGLRVKLTLAIVLVNLVTGLIVFVSLSEFQTREKRKQIIEESVLFSEFSTDKIISDFSNFFYFYYHDRFIPAIRSVISTNENLINIEVVSYRTRSILFDSRKLFHSEDLAQSSDINQKEKKFSLDSELESKLESKDIVSFLDRSEDQEILNVVSIYRNENQEPLFLVSYRFGFDSLYRSIRLIREQILRDLIPSLLFGLLIAILFAQFLIAPLRKVISAMNRVATGDFDISLRLNRADELGDLLNSFNQMTVQLKKKKELQKYLSDSTYRQVMQSEDYSNSGDMRGMRLSATVLFVDIRNFVNHCENLPAEEITTMLNDYFSEMVEVVYKYAGEVDKFIGDALLAVFYEKDGDPQLETSTSLQAFYCALEMRDRLYSFNQKRKVSGRKEIDIGIGISYGEVISGPIGSKDRRDFTVIGDVVNLASRIEKLSKKGKHTKIVFSHHLESKVKGLLEYELVDSGSIRGKSEEVKVFELIRVREIDALVQNLESADQGSEVQLKSVELLGQSRNLEALPHVLKLLSSTHQSVRLKVVNSIRILSPLGDASVIQVLFDRLAVETNEKVISALISAIGTICNDKRLLELRSYLDSSNERIVANAIEAIHRLGTPEANDLILSKLSSLNNRIKANAAMALFSSGHFEVIQTLKPMLLHSNPLMRSSAAFAIGELTSLSRRDQLIEYWRNTGVELSRILAEIQETVPMLVALLKDPDEVVRRQSVIALSKIKDRSAILPIIECVRSSGQSQELKQDCIYALRSIGSHKLVSDVLDSLS